jgi:hypothetical protein
MRRGCRRAPRAALYVPSFPMPLHVFMQPCREWHVLDLPLSGSRTELQRNATVAMQAAAAGRLDMLPQLHAWHVG